MIFNFEANADISKWQVVNDGVMGGRSQSAFYLNDAGHGVFEGTVSLENNGGFASVRHRFDAIVNKDCQYVAIRLKGDGKRYQFRVKSTLDQRHSYIAYVETSGAWQTIILPLQNLYPAFRGQKLALPNFDGKNLSEIAFLIGNKNAEAFHLEMDWIRLQ
ncbi:MAG: CIA30 family protein [Flavobacteriaceae bacterium]